ncbi:MAG: flavodoxin [Clostridia bacterium]|nr:flavodoxin [Clostridia bacterium]
MKRYIVLLLSLLMIFSLFACGSKVEEKPDMEEKNDAPAAEESEVKKNTVLVAYFSRTGNTKELAEYAIEYLNADVFEIEAKAPYTDADINYGNSNSRTSKEQNDKSMRPEIAGTVTDFSQYETVIIAYPIWWGQAPRIIDTFMESNDFSGKTVVPFCTSASSGIGSSDTYLHNLASDDVNWKEGKRFAAGTSKDIVVNWLKDLKIEPYR